jgi:hypothetical protein
VKYSFAILLFVVIVIAALARLGAGNTNNSLIDNPPAEAVGTAIQQIDTITEIGIVTEDNDPNHQLGKRGGYTGCLFFTDSNAPKIDGTDIIERGTDGGGCIEIYANANDAKKRDKYLGSFDGSIFASGSHTVVGTLVVRTSSKMKISQQKKLESQLIDVLNGKSPSVSVNAPKKVAAQSTRVLIEHGETEVGTITTTPENATIPGSTSVQSIDSAYQAILDEYSKKIRTVTPRLIDEYRAEAAKNSAGLMGLAQISMTKVSKLAEISNEGISKMAEIMMSTGMGKYEVYEAWSEKLMGVYTKEAEKITDTYHYNEDFKLTNPHQYDSCFV